MAFQRIGKLKLTVFFALAIFVRVPASAQDATDDAWVFRYTENTFSADAALDLRSLNERQAGEHGFVRLAPDGNSFVRGDGQPIRFWGVNAICKKFSAEQWRQQARWLAKIGVNMIRYSVALPSHATGAHIPDSNAEEIDTLWRAVAAMKAEGIYTAVIDYSVLTDYANVDRSDWDLPGYAFNPASAKDKKPNCPWAVMFFNSKLRDGFKSWLRDAYTRPNPYTGVALINEPAIVLNQLVTEDSLLWYTVNGLAPEQMRELSRQYGTWLKTRYGSLENARKQWLNVAIPEGKALIQDNFEAEIVGLYNIWEATRDGRRANGPMDPGKSQRLSDQIEFLADTMYGFYQDMGHFFHDELRGRSLVLCGNWRAADSVNMQDAERWTYSAGDMIAENHFFNGIHQGRDSGWRVQAGDRMVWRTALKPLELDDNPPYFMKQIAGRAAIVTSTAWVYPNLYQSEGPFLCAVYGSLAGLDGINWEGFSSQPEYDMQGVVPINPTTDFMLTWNCARPPIASSFPAAALAFRNGYIACGKPVVEEQCGFKAMWSGETPAISDHELPVSANDRHVDPLAFLVGPVLATYGGDPTESKVTDLLPYIDRQACRVKSNTGEIELDYKTGVCSVNAPRAQGAAGFLAQAGAIHLHDLDISSRDTYAAILAVPLDGQPIASSSRILIQIGTTVRPTGWSTRPTTWKTKQGVEISGEEVVSTGKAPWKIANTHASLVVHNSGITKCTALDPMGRRSLTVPIVREGDGLKFDAPPDCLYLLVE